MPSRTVDNGNQSPSPEARNSLHQSLLCMRVVDPDCHSSQLVRLRMGGHVLHNRPAAAAVPVLPDSLYAQGLGLGDRDAMVFPSPFNRINPVTFALREDGPVVRRLTVVALQWGICDAMPPCAAPRS